MIVTDSVYNSALPDDLVPKYIRSAAFQINETISKFREYLNPQLENVEFPLSNTVTQYQNGGFLELTQTHFENLETASVKLLIPSQIHQDIRSIISFGHNTVFEDGIDNEFYASLDSTIRHYGIIALKIIQEQITSSLLNAEISTEILRYLGEMQHIPSYGLRLQILIHALQNRSAKVRDGASLGLASLNDQNAIQALKNAIRQEKVTDLREDLQLVLEQLEELS